MSGAIPVRRKRVSTGAAMTCGDRNHIRWKQGRKVTKGSKSRRSLHSAANLIGSRGQDVVVIIFESLKALPVKTPYRGGA